MWRVSWNDRAEASTRLPVQNPTERLDGPLGASLEYWRDFGSRYLTELCHIPEHTDGDIAPIPPPEAALVACGFLNLWLQWSGLKRLAAEIDKMAPVLSTRPDAIRR